MGKATTAVARGRWRSNRSTVPPESCIQIGLAAAAGGGGAAAKTKSITAKGVRGANEVVPVAGGALAPAAPAAVVAAVDVSITIIVADKAEAEAEVGGGIILCPRTAGGEDVELTMTMPGTT